MMLMGMPVYVSPLACTYTQKKVYPRCRSKSKAHHARMNKKWLKRYGQTMTPCVFHVMGEVLVHPLLMPAFK